MGRSSACENRRFRVILFLDYDGVLHPDPCLADVRLFENAPRLASVLENFPEIAVVLSTSWRNKCSSDELLDPLPESLRQRVIGTTPRFGDFSTAGKRHPYHRQAECEQWLRLYGMQDSPWWALDDRPEWFAPYSEHLLECNPQRGFDERMAARLASTLTVARLRAQSEVDLILA